jgi:hypothetical protein
MSPGDYYTTCRNADFGCFILSFLQDSSILCVAQKYVFVGKIILGMYLQPAVGKLLLESSGVTLLPLLVKENRYF